MKNMELKDTLKSIQLCKYLELHELDILLQYCSMASFPTGEIILQQGKKSPGLYIILDGKVSLMAKILGGGITDIIPLERGDMLGEISLIEKAPCATSAIADSTVTCLLLSADYFEMLSLFLPEMKFKIIKSITEKIGKYLLELHKKITHYMTQSQMAHRSAFGEVMKRLTHSTTITPDEIGITQDELQEASLFQFFNRAEFTALIQSTTIIKAPAKCTLIAENENSSACYIVLRGAVQSSIIENNILAKLSVLGPMSLFCSIFFTGHTEATIINYTTCERAILLKIPADYFLNLQKTKPELWYKLYDLICQSFVDLQRAADKLDIRLNSETYNR